jgi:signal transduction histidine kinase
MKAPEMGRLFLVPARTVVDPDEAKEAEYALTVAQAFLAWGCLLAIYIDPAAPAPYTLLARLSLLLYASFSVLMAVVVRLQSHLNRPLRLVLHVTGVFWTGITFLFTKAGSYPVFVVFLLFILLAAAYRWGLAQTLFTAGSCAALILLVGNTTAAGPHYFSALNIPGPSHWTIAVLLLGCVLGYLLENEKRLRSETLVTSRLFAKARAGAGMRETLQTTIRAMLDLFNSSRIAVAVQHTGSRQSFLWDAERQGTQDIPVQLRQLAPPDQDTYFFTFPGESWCATMLRGSVTASRFRVMALSNQDERLHRVSCFLPYSFLSRHGFRSLLAVSFTCGKEWSGRVFVFNPRRRRQPEADLRFLRKLIPEVVPVVYNLYILGRLRSHVRKVERTRIAQDLHDGTIQSLIALEVEVGALSRQVKGDGIAEELRLIQSQLASEIQDFRDLMERVKPIELCPSQLVSCLGDIVDKFRIRTGISASFVCESGQITVPLRVCHELVRILQEALVNVRKHSGAHEVVVRCVPMDGHLRVTIDDDGRGFDFSGRLSFAELEATGKGPVVIKERLRSIGGECALESVPGRGARLEILLPI